MKTERKKRPKIWNEETLGVLRKYAPTLKPADIAAMIPGATRSAVIGKINYLGIQRRGRNDLYAPEDDEFIRENVDRLSAAEIGHKLGRTEKSVWARIKLIGLRKPVKSPPRAPKIERVALTDIQSPHARDWRSRCDTPDREECAYLIDSLATACCNPVIGGESTLAKRYCHGHYTLMIDTEAMQRARARRGTFTRPDTIRRHSTVLSTGWDL